MATNTSCTQIRPKRCMGRNGQSECWKVTGRSSLPDAKTLLASASILQSLLTFGNVPLIPNHWPERKGHSKKCKRFFVGRSTRRRTQQKLCNCGKLAHRQILSFLQDLPFQNSFRGLQSRRYSTCIIVSVCVSARITLMLPFFAGRPIIVAHSMSGTHTATILNPAVNLSSKNSGRFQEVSILWSYWPKKTSWQKQKKLSVFIQHD